MKTKTLTSDKTKSKKERYCSSYDNECKDVNDPHHCFLGMPQITQCCGEIVHFGLADGICKEMEIRRK